MIRLDPEAWQRLPGLWACALTLSHVERGHPDDLPEAHTVLRPGLTLDTLKEDQVAAGYRRISWAVGVDPTKQRPAGEALARRILAEKPLPVIHPLVDAYNLASAHTLVPLSAYDIGRISTPLTVRPAKDKELFLGIGRGTEVALEKGRLVYASAEGTLCGVMLWRDALASAIRPQTERAVLLAVGAEPLGSTVGIEALQTAAEYAGRVGWRQDSPIVQAES